MEVKLIIPQKGGKRISEGAYGCIFTPPLICRGNKAPHGGWKSGRLGKLTDKNDIKGEILAAEVFERKPEAKKYFILPDTSTLCIPAPISQQKETHFSKCDILNKKSYSDMLHYEVEYGGKTLHDTLPGKDDTLDTIQLFLKEFSFYKFMGELLEIGAYLVLNGCIHNDLHSSNILVNKQYHPRLIDFGRSYFVNTITDEKLEMLVGMDFAPSLTQVTPEANIQDGLISHMPLTKILEGIYQEKPNLINAERILGVSRHRELVELRQFWNTSVAAQQGDWLRFYQLYWPVVDSWALGGILVGLLKKLSISKQFTESADWKQRQSIIKNILKGMLKASPRLRLDCVEALALYDPMNDVVLSEAGKTWLQKKQQQKKRV